MAIKVAITEEEFEAGKGPSFDLLPTGWYNVEITDAVEKEFASEANKGKPYVALTLRVIDGDFTGRKVWANVPLFLRWNNEKKSPTNFVQFFTAVSEEDGEPIFASVDDEGNRVLEEVDLEAAEDLLTKRVTARIRVTSDTYRIEKGEKDALRNDVGSFRAYDPDDDPSPSKAEAAAAAAAASEKGKGGAKKAAPKKGGLDL